MSEFSLAIVVLAAGKGTRMRSSLPKVLHKIGCEPMLRHVLSACEALLPQRVVVVVAPGMSAVAAAAHPHKVAIQAEQRGTGDAVAAALPALSEGAFTDVLVVYGDTPLIRPETLRRLVDERRRTGAALVVLGLRLEPPNAYGRLILGEDGELEAIVEAVDASPEQLAISFCNSGVMVVEKSVLARLLGRLTASNRQGELYLTDIVALARADGLSARTVEGAAEELSGINSRGEQAAAEALLQKRLRDAAMAGGATLIDPDTVWFAADTKLGRDVVIGPNVMFGVGVTIEDEVEIKAHSCIEGAIVRRGGIIGPFARLRPGTEVGPGAHVGNFVELKNTLLGAGAKANHLSYLGDAEIGQASNIGAGTITCNYDGFAKHRTVIGAGVFVGSDTALVAPVTVGDGAIIAAGSVVTQDVAPDALAIARSAQVEKPGHAARFRARKGAQGTGR